MDFDKERVFRYGMMEADMKDIGKTIWLTERED
jgi:hypothetical protein